MSGRLDETFLDDVEALEAADGGHMLLAAATSGAQVREAATASADAGLHRVADEGRPRAVVILGSGTAALTGEQYSFCSPAVAATQMALLSSLSGLASSVFGPLAGGLVADYGYTQFFLICIALAVPGIVLAYFVTSPAIERRGSVSESSATSPA